MVSCDGPGVEITANASSQLYPASQKRRPAGCVGCRSGQAPRQRKNGLKLTFGGGWGWRGWLSAVSRSGWAAASLLQNVPSRRIPCCRHLAETMLFIYKWHDGGLQRQRHRCRASCLQRQTAWHTTHGGSTAATAVMAPHAWCWSSPPAQVASLPTHHHQ